jgi:hypothetical protein
VIFLNNLKVAFSDYVLRMKPDKRAVKAGGSHYADAADLTAERILAGDEQIVARLKGDVTPFVVTADGALRFADASGNEEIV